MIKEYYNIWYRVKGTERWASSHLEEMTDRGVAERKVEAYERAIPLREYEIRTTRIGDTGEDDDIPF